MYLLALPRVELGRALAVVLPDQREEVPAEQLLLGELRQPRARGIDEGEAPFEIAVVDDVGRLLGELAVAHLAFAQRLFRAPALGDVPVVDDDAADARIVEAVDADAFDVAPRAVLVPQPERVLHRHARLLEPLCRSWP